MRMLVAWYPDWPVVAAGRPPSTPAAVVRANRVVAATAAARADGVRPGLRRREAQGRCPELEVIPSDTGRDVRAWEPAVVALETLTPGVEILAPGGAALGTRGPSRYFGGDEALAAQVAETVDRAVGQTGCQVGVADGRFAAELAARAVDGRPVRVIPPGLARRWLAPQPVTALGWEFEALSDLLVRLGIRTLGDLAALPAPAVLGRFGPREPGPIVWRAARMAARWLPAPRRRIWRSPPSWTLPPSGWTGLRSWPSPWRTSWMSGWPGTGWRARSWPSRPRPSTANNWCAAGGMKGRSPRPRFPSGPAGSSMAG